MPTQPFTTDNRLNEGYEYRERLGSEAEGLTVLEYLSQRYCHSSPTEWAARIESGQVLIGAQPVHHARILRRGDELIWLRPPWTEPEAPTSFSILYEDECLLAVHKPAGLPTMPGGNFLQSTLLHLVHAYAPDAAPVHRLGRWTSGIVLCARNHNARTDLMRQWTAKKVVKRYRALISGHPTWNELTISASIGLVPHPLLGSLHAAHPKGKISLSHVLILQRRTDCSLCDVWIETGRPHQIRIHLASAGHPLTGDPLYIAGGVPANDSQAVPGDPGYHLHAAELCFRHPTSEHLLTIDSEPPSELQITAEKL